jgi:hypothetical protein
MVERALGSHILPLFYGDVPVARGLFLDGGLCAADF